MKNEFRSTNASDTSFGTTNYGIQSGSSMGTTVAPDIAGHEARQAARRRKRNKILTVSIIICLVAVVSAFFAIYTTTDWFKATPPAPSDLVIDDDVTTPTRVAVVDREAFTEAQRLGDFSGLSGGADASLWVEPFLIGYKLVAEDDSIVKIADSKIYGWTPGITTVRVETADGQLVDTITIEVLDANGRLYYYIDFFAESTDINNDTAEPLYTLQVISGRTISFMTAELPALPSKRGYDPQYWTVGGARFFPSDTVTSDIKAYVTWAAKSVSFLSSLDGNLDNGAYKADYSVDISDYVDRQSASGSFTYTAENLPEGLTLDPSTGIIEGRPQEAGTYIFSITATDNLQSEEDRQATADTKEFTLQVAKRVAGVVISDRNLTYNGDLQTLPVQITNIAEGDTGNVIAVVNYINSEEDGVKDADTYTAKVVSLSGSRASNYTLPGTAVTRTFTVAPRVAEIEFLSPTNNFRFSYDGTEKTIFARVNNLVDGDVCGVELSYSGDRFNVTAEGVEATAAALTNPNYTLPSSQRTHKFYIDPASLTLTIDANQSKVYACNEPDYTFTVSG
ncbi:MAG: Ig domain-containing protein, partial [Clostridia bacterium]|nr:Ig domain-containing protein [Clostridia bacterium]